MSIKKILNFLSASFNVYFKFLSTEKKAIKFYQNGKVFSIRKNLIFTIVSNKKEERHLMCRRKNNPVKHLS